MNTATTDMRTPCLPPPAATSELDSTNSDLYRNYGTRSPVAAARLFTSLDTAVTRKRDRIVRSGLIKRLPNDVLELILTFCCQRFVDLIRYSHIDKTWRHAAFQCPLWRSINLSYKITYVSVNSYRSSENENIHIPAIDRSTAMPQVIAHQFIEEYIRLHKRWRQEKYFFERVININHKMHAVAEYLVAFIVTTSTLCCLLAAYAFSQVQDEPIARVATSWSFELGFACIEIFLCLYLILFVEHGIYNITLEIAVEKANWKLPYKGTFIMASLAMFQSGMIALAAVTQWKLTHAPYVSDPSWVALMSPLWVFFIFSHIFIVLACCGATTDSYRPAMRKLNLGDLPFIVGAAYALYSIAITFTVMAYRQDVYNRTKNYPFLLGYTLIPIIPHMLGLCGLALWRFGAFLHTLYRFIRDRLYGGNPIAFVVFRSLGGLAGCLLIASILLILSLTFTDIPLVYQYLTGNPNSTLPVLGALMLGGLQATLALIPIEGRFAG